MTPNMDGGGGEWVIEGIVIEVSTYDLHVGVCDKGEDFQGPSLKYMK